MAAEGDSAVLCVFVNGRKVIVRDPDPDTMLLSFLRDKLQLTGTKYGCGGGGCGACTVMLSTYDTQTQTINHFSVNACLMPLCQTHGAAVTTVEGIGNSKSKLHPVQERIAKANGSQCGFCTPGMVMSMYTLLRNRPQPSMEDITQALGGNLCRCTGYRPIIDGYRTFCESESCCQVNGVACCTSNNKAAPEQLQLFNKEEFLPLDPTQDLIFPPELIRMAESQDQTTRTFRGERMTWISPASLGELLQLKSQYPQAPIVMGNTNIGLDIKFKGVVHPIIISGTRVKELFEVSHKPEGVHFGAGCTLSTMLCVLQKCVCSLPAEQTQTYSALLEQLRHLGGEQIRNVATLGGNIASAYPNSDLNPVLAAGRSSVLLLSHDGRREVPLDKDFFVGFGKTILRPDEIVLSVFIPISRECEVVCAFRNAPRKENALATVSAGMRVWLHHHSDLVRDMSVYYGGVGAHTLSAESTTRHVIGRAWSEETLSDAYTSLLDDVTGAAGGKVVFRRSLTLSMFFRFYLRVLQHLRDQNIIQSEIPKHELSAVEPLSNYIQPGYQEFQAVSEGECVGRAFPHCSSVSHATGEAIYCDDIPHTHGELFLSVVTSTRAHAKITHVDVGGALAMEGVVDVVTAEDIPGRRSVSFTVLDEELLAHDQVACVGHMICAVIADTMQHAKLAAAAVKVVYEDLKDPIFTVEEAMEKSSYFLPLRKIQRGDVVSALQETDHVYEGELRLGGQEHFYMETQSMLVIPVGEEKEMKVYVSTQHPTLVQMAIAETLAIPSNRVSCHVKRIGGAFGGKVTKTTVLACITAVAAWKTERPVRCVLERGEDMLITGGRHPVLGRYKVGFMNDGRITSADVYYYANAGSSPDESPLVAEKILLQMDNCYNIPNLRGHGAACRTNLPSNTAFRGFGVPQSMMVIENMINDVAMMLGRPAEEIREKNMYKEISFTHYKMEFDPENLQRCWEECKQRADIAHRRENITRFNLQHRWRKRGLAIVPIKYGVGFAEGFLNQAAALVHIYKDGSVLISHGGTEMGQGLHTKVQQVASRELNIPLSLIHITETCTSAVPNTSPSAASFGTDANGMAVRDACRTLYKRLEPIRLADPDAPWQSWIKRAFLDRISLSATGFYRGQDAGMDWEKQEGRPYPYFTYGTCCSEVEIDCLSGEYRTVRTDLVMDIGRSLNPSIDIGQIEGAFIQGLGLYTMEELHFSPSGVLYTRGPGQYKIPAVCDVPLQFNVYLLAGSENPHAIYSSKGTGEPAVFLGSSVFFAIKDAAVAARRDAGLTGPFTLNSPSTPEQVCLACNTHFTQMIKDTEPEVPKAWALQLP
ncbi:aldehyde oxidase 6 [Clarias gariepinus]|uniref:aldehyde oxidase 6 n=1 Tax=Clarias gariepinus TaxID=13013 RepID=UPI00234E0278|nr:aldehyde oxidase 6 [Clarias gariepinus]